jgi:hypothetical protein
MMASQYGCTAIVHLLLEAGANKQTMNNVSAREKITRAHSWLRGKMLKPSWGLLRLVISPPSYMSDDCAHGLLSYLLVEECEKFGIRCLTFFMSQ